MVSMRAANDCAQHKLIEKLKIEFGTLHTTNLSCARGTEIGERYVTKQDQAKITWQEKVSTIAFLDAVSLYFLANIGFSPLFIVFIL